jgi:2-succinyl-6-hydroxy-2,4-cyclohexadiene-1-carboxylate synthase
LRYPDDYTMEGAARQLLPTLDAHGINRCLVVGYSMGGRLALHLAVHHASRFHGVVLESARPGLATPGEREQRVAQDEARAEEMESGDFASFLHSWYRQPLFGTLSRKPGRIEALIASRSGNTPSELARSLRAMGAGRQGSLWPELPGLTVPVLAVAGADDSTFVPIAQQMADLSPSVEAAIVADAGHNVHLEQPGEFARVLKAFARRVLTRD